MPESSDYEAFDVAILVGGLARHLSWKQIPPTHWYSAKGYDVREHQLISAPGYRAFVNNILSPEYQDHFDVGAIFACYNTSGVFATFKIHSDVSPVDLGLFWSGESWEIKNEVDGETAWTAWTTNPSGASTLFTITTAGYYPGLTWQLGSILDVNDPDHRKRRYLARIVTPHVGSVHQNCPVIKIASFEKEPGVYELYAHTTRDIYKYDQSNEEFAQNDRINQLYTTGTADFENPSATFVTGTATTWSADGIEADSLIKADADPSYAWTRIKTVHSDTSIELIEPYKWNATGGAVAYTIIKAYMAGGNDLSDARKMRWSSCTWASGSPSNLYIVANSHNTIQKHDGGTGQMVDLGGLTAIAEGATSIDVLSANVVIPYMESLCIGGGNEGGISGTGYQPRRVRWSDPRDCEAYTAYKYRDLEGSDEIKAAAILGNTCVWITTNGVHNQNFQLSPIDFTFQRRDDEIGTNSPGTLVNTGDGYLRWLGPDDFYMYDLVRPQRFGQPVRDVVFSAFNDEYAAMAEAHWDAQTGLYLVSIPNADSDLWNWTTFAYNVRDKRWLNPMDGHMCFGEAYLGTARPVIDDYTEIIDSYSDRVFDERAGVATRTVLAGGRNGQIHQIFTGLDRDRADSEASIIFGMTDLGKSGLKRLGWLTFTHDAADFGIDVYVGLSRDGKRLDEWVGPLTHSLSTAIGEDRQEILTVDRKARWFAFRFDNIKRNQGLVMESLRAHFRMSGRG